MAEIYDGVTSTERWDNLKRHRGLSDADVGRTERLVSGLVGAALIGLSLRKRRLRPLLFPLATGLIARALTGRGPAKRALARTEPPAEPGQSGRQCGPGAGNPGRAEHHHQPAGAGGLPLLAQFREPAPIHGSSRVRHGDR